MPERTQTRAFRFGVPLTLAVAALALSACSVPVTVQPAPGAANPACAPLMIALPDTLGDAPLRKTTSQATAAWGDPAAVVLRCGVRSPGPTTERCVSVNGVDWVIQQDGTESARPAPATSAAQPNPAGSGPAPGGEGGTYTLTTFGRDPATELLLDSDRISSATVLASLSAAVSKVPATKHCVGQEDLAKLPAGG